nr:ornithine decarboxylase [Biomphalaria glabrata]
MSTGVTVQLEMAGGHSSVSIDLYNSVTTMDDLVQERVSRLQAYEHDTTFIIANIGTLYSQLSKWKELMPRVKPFYALKCNNDPVVTKVLADIGLGFDCASQSEIEQILQLGVHPSRIVFANPNKHMSHLRFAAQNNVDLMTFDDICEVLKIKQSFPNARLLLRIKTRRHFRARHTFNKKFGCDPCLVRSLLVQCKQLSVNVVGFSFHIGSLPEENSYFTTTIADVSELFQIGQELGFRMTILDIGGGFPGVDTEKQSFQKVAKEINEALERHFPTSRGVDVIAEPGRYFVTSCFTLAVQVMSKKVVAESFEANDQNVKMNEHTIVNEHTILNEHSHQNGHIYLNGCAPDNKLMFESPSEHTNDDSHIITNGHTSANGHIIVNRHTSANGHATLSNLDTVEKHRFLNGLSHENGRIERPDHETAYVYMYFINDGLFGTFSNVRTDQLVARPSFLKDCDTKAMHTSILWGPTCAESDCVMKECLLPELRVGQWLFFQNMGAYSVTQACGFNGIEPPLKFYVCDQKTWDLISHEIDLAASQVDLSPFDMIVTRRQCTRPSYGGPPALNQTVL